MLCDYATDDDAARQFVLGRVALLQLSEAAELLFVGSEAGQAVAAITVAGQAAVGIAAAWRADTGFPDGLTIRVLQVEARGNGLPATFP